MILLIITMIIIRPDGTVGAAEHFVQHEPTYAVCAANRARTEAVASERPDKKNVLIMARCERVELRPTV